MANKHQVLALFDGHPDWTSTQIAERLDCDPAYVRTTLARNGRRLRRRCLGGDQRRKIDYGVAREMRSLGQTYQQIADRFSVGISAVSRALAQS